MQVPKLDRRRPWALVDGTVRGPAVAAFVLLVLLAGCGGGSAQDATTSTLATSTSRSSSSAPSASTAVPSTSTSTSTTAPASSTSTTVAEDVIEIEVRYEGGVVEGGGAVDVPLGSTVRIRVRSDVADEIHLHGYDLTADVPAGGETILEFTADVPGIFEVELERSRVPIVELEVR